MMDRFVREESSTVYNPLGIDIRFTQIWCFAYITIDVRDHGTPAPAYVVDDPKTSERTPLSYQQGYASVPQQYPHEVQQQASGYTPQTPYIFNQPHGGKVEV